MLGVNTAGLQEQEGNSLFYAIDIGKVRDFLSKKGFGNILLWNQRLTDVATAKLDALGEFESSADLILDIDKNVDVLLDNSKMGTGSMFLHLVNPISLLKLHGPKGDFTVKLRLLSTLQGSTTLKPSLASQAIPVSFNSNPSGAMVIADGKSLGETPLNVSLAADKYTIQLRQEGQWYENTTAEIRAGQLNEFDFHGQTAYPITLKELTPNASTTFRFDAKLAEVTFQGSEKVSLPTGDWNLKIEGNDAFAGITIPFQVHHEPVTLILAYPITLKDLPADAGIILRFTSKLGKATFRGAERVSLPTGDWNLNIEGNDAFAGVTIRLQVQHEPVILDLAPLKKRGSLRIVGFDSKGKLWIDDKLWPNPTNDTVQLIVGDHAVYVWEDGLQPLDKKNIIVRGDNTSHVTWDRLRGHDANSALLLWSGVGGGTLGAVLLGLGWYSSQNSVALSQTNSYQGYLNFRTGAA